MLLTLFSQHKSAKSMIFFLFCMKAYIVGRFLVLFHIKLIIVGRLLISYLFIYLFFMKA